VRRLIEQIDFVMRDGSASVVEGMASSTVLAKDLVGLVGPFADKLVAAIENAMEEFEGDMEGEIFSLVPGGIDSPRSDAVLDLAWKVLWRQVGKRLRAPGTDAAKMALGRS